MSAMHVSTTTQTNVLVPDNYGKTITYTQLASKGVFSMMVDNNTQSRLPETGGAGLYIVAGVAIVALLGFGGTAMLKRKVNGGE